MSRPPINHNVLVSHIDLPRETRDYLSLLARRQELCPTGTVTELVSQGTVAFLAAKPWLAEDWKWSRAGSHLKWVKGKRVPHPDWVLFHMRLADTTVNGAKVSSDDVVQALRDLAVAVPKRTRTDTGMSAVYFSLIQWIVTELFPPAQYAAPVYASPVQGFGIPDFLKKATKRLVVHLPVGHQPLGLSA